MDVKNYILCLILLCTPAYAQTVIRVKSEAEHPLRHRADRILTDSGSNVQTTIDGLVPYVGATGSVNLGSNAIVAGSGTFGTVNYTTLNPAVDVFVLPPTLATNPCTTHNLAEDNTYLYVCVETNQWMRVALNTWANAEQFLLIDSDNYLIIDDAGHKVRIQ